MYCSGQARVVSRNIAPPSVTGLWGVGGSSENSRSPCWVLRRVLSGDMGMSDFWKTGYTSLAAGHGGQKCRRSTSGEFQSGWNGVPPVAGGVVSCTSSLLGWRWTVSGRSRHPMCRGSHRSAPTAKSSCSPPQKSRPSSPLAVAVSPASGGRCRCEHRRSLPGRAIRMVGVPAGRRCQATAPARLPDGVGSVPESG